MLCRNEKNIPSKINIFTWLFQQFIDQGNIHVVGSTHYFNTPCTFCVTTNAFPPWRDDSSAKSQKYDTHFSQNFVNLIE